MKQYYEINITNRGEYETYTFKNQKLKNKWLVNYLTVGEGAEWGNREYIKYLKERLLAGKHPMPIERYILKLVENRVSFVITNKNKILLVRKKFFEK